MPTKKYKRERFNTREEWLKSRGFGGSSASAILGKNPYMTALDLYRAIVQPKKSLHINENECLMYGNNCEPLIRKIFQLDFNEKYLVRAPRGNEMYRRLDKPYMTATLDGILTDKQTKEKGVLEIKTHDIRNRKDEENWASHIPDNYYIQVLHYLAVMNDFTFGVLVAKLRFFDYFDKEGKKLLRTETRYYYIDRNDAQVKKDIEYLEKKETDFWENNITKKVMPSLQFKF
jgi:putative phage-type endonuclease